MRILVLSDLYPPYFVGGHELNCELQAVELANRGHAVFVLTSRWKAGKGRVEGNVHRLLHLDPLWPALYGGKGSTDTLRLRRRWRQLKWAVACRGNYAIADKIMAAVHPDLAYVWHMAGVSLMPVLAAQDRGIPTVFNIGSYWLADLKKQLDLEPNWLKRRYRGVLSGLGRVEELDLAHMLVISRWLMQSYVELGFAGADITVIPRGMPSALLRDVKEPPELRQPEAHRVRLAFVGRLIPKKGADVAIKAIAHLVDDMGMSDIGLDIIGTGPDEHVRELKNMATGLGLGERVQFLGQLEHAQVLVRYAEYHALLFPSRWAEPFGMAIVEAMARGVPVIATHCGGVPEIISDGENGLVVPVDDPVLLANAVKSLVQDPALAQRMRRTALRTVREHYTLEKVLDQTENYLEMVVQRARTPSTAAG